MARFAKSPMFLALSVLSEAHAQHYLKECQGIKLQKVQELTATTSILNVHCTVELIRIEFHPSDNREEVLQQKAIHMRKMTPHHQENCVAALHLSSAGKDPLIFMCYIIDLGDF